MSKAYSSKALPAGTVLREWRLEEVLGVGGFGIVYKGRGIYFDELVAIKEYFPSAISDRKEGDTVVPIDSEAEEVHALGLKKFVEEAKLLWNLSTPSRHPNIVSVRSLFEIHGTAYMVMDFEDGISLSRLLKEGRRFNQLSLLNLLQPIAEGLERAHRVGVLHRDIKPGNILVNADGRPVLIDFGSARFESGEATSTKVTFHTPPYAAIEQYVKTYDQGPWTDIYALGVVLYECITGQKPPEVLERMHGGAGKLLVDSEWPGYSSEFLRAVDAAMIIKPSERPQSISEWLALLDAPAGSTAAEPDEDDDATRFVAFDTQSHRIVPVAPPPPGFDRVEDIDTGVPEEVAEAQFKLPGQTTDVGVKVATAADLAAQDGASPPAPAPSAAPAPSVAPASPPPPPPKPPGKSVAAPGAKVSGGGKLPLIISGAAVLALAGAGGGWLLLKGKSPQGAAPTSASIAGNPAAGDPEASAMPTDLPASASPAAAIAALSAEARRANAPAPAVQALAGAAARLSALPTDQQGKPEAGAISLSASRSFASLLLADVEQRAQRVARERPWADPRRAGAASAEGRERQRIQAKLMQARGAVTASAAAVSRAADPQGGLIGARQALASWRTFTAFQFRAASAPAEQVAIAAQSVSTVAEPVIAPVEAAPKGKGVSPAKFQQLAAIDAECRGIAERVIAMGRAARLRPGASDKEKENYRTLQQNLTSAQGYQTYLTNLGRSMRGAKNDREAEGFISQGEQTRRYLMLLLSRSTAASR